jgi:prevent-host-death family protein
MISTNGGTIDHEVALERGDDDGFAVLGRTVGIRALARNVSGVVDEVASSGLPVILTKHGRPVAAIVPIDAVALQ